MTNLTKKHLVPFDASYSAKMSNTKAEKSELALGETKGSAKSHIKKLSDLQNIFYAAKSHALLLIFQGLDASGKDSAIRAVMSGVNPAGCQVTSFKEPNAEELDHDFLWRTTKKLPPLGMIGIFNRSYYEDVLIVRVHTELLKGKNPNSQFWQNRLDAIVAHEKHLAAGGTVILKFWLNISKAEQNKRFLKRLNSAEHNWKFSESDLAEREFFSQHQIVAEQAVRATSKEHAPWYLIPADNKAYCRAAIAEIIVDKLSSLGLSYPKFSGRDKAYFGKMKKLLLAKP